MPVLSNPRHERFAQEVAKGKSATEAYVLAGYKAHDGNASTLRGNQRLLDRVAEIQSRGAERAEVTVQTILAELEAARLKADELKQPAVMVAASMGKAKVAGLIIDKAEKGKPGDFDFGERVNAIWRQQRESRKRLDA